MTLARDRMKSRSRVWSTETFTRGISFPIKRRCGMEYPESPRPIRSTEPGFGGFRAIQEYAAVTCSDWQAFQVLELIDGRWFRSCGVANGRSHQP